LWKNITRSKKSKKIIESYQEKKSYHKVTKNVKKVNKIAFYSFLTYFDMCPFFFSEFTSYL
jgi:hypothetical protein